MRGRGDAGTRRRGDTGTRRHGDGRLGVILAEGPNDVIALDTFGVPAVAACSNTMTEEQVGKVARFAKQLSGGSVTVMFDCDEEGEKGAKQAVWGLSQHCRVRLAWSPTMHGGKFRGWQPESLTAEEWAVIAQHLAARGSRGE